MKEVKIFMEYNDVFLEYLNSEEDNIENMEEFLSSYIGIKPRYLEIRPTVFSETRITNDGISDEEDNSEESDRKRSTDEVKKISREVMEKDKKKNLNPQNKAKIATIKREMEKSIKMDPNSLGNDTKLKRLMRVGITMLVSFGIIFAPAVGVLIKIIALIGVAATAKHVNRKKLENTIILLMDKIKYIEDEMEKASDNPKKKYELTRVKRELQRTLMKYQSRLRNFH
ncbi:hypothetical protein FPHOBKDP_00138 [Listeria phage LPJP1]|nr:hypothetical protein FPHOBKDP_00138 [Listeria phage LPJP1]